MSTIEHMANHEEITPDMVLSLQKPTTTNVYNVDFLEFEIIDDDTSNVMFKVAREPSPGHEMLDDLDPDVEESMRTIRYSFPKQFLLFKSVRTSLVFSVGDKPMENFRMIERHYHGEKLIRSYDFDFGFCVPLSKNSWEALYPLPTLDEDQIQDMIDEPFSNKSDSFYFAGTPPRLIMHNKAEYEWLDESGSA